MVLRKQRKEIQKILFRKIDKDDVEEIKYNEENNSIIIELDEEKDEVLKELVEDYDEKIGIKKEKNIYYIY